MSDSNIMKNDEKEYIEPLDPESAFEFYKGLGFEYVQNEEAHHILEGLRLGMISPGIQNITVLERMPDNRQLPITLYNRRGKYIDPRFWIYTEEIYIPEEIGIFVHYLDYSN